MVIMCRSYPIGCGIVHCERFNRDLIWVDCPIARYQDIWQGINWHNYRRLRYRQINSCKKNNTVTQLKIQLP